MIDLLGTQLYQSPLALLRENTPNAYDAILQRMRREPEFRGAIDIRLSPDQISVSDNGIGMTADDLEQHFWFAGSSSKNNDEAREAGVVGTFGIGAMANFGIAGELVVETESLKTGTRTKSSVTRANLKLNQDCIEFEDLSPTQRPGTTVISHVTQPNTINVSEAVNYISDFVALLETEVSVNGVRVSGKGVEVFVSKPPFSWNLDEKACAVGSRLTADIILGISKNAEIWIELSNIFWSGQPFRGQLTLRSGTSALRTCRSGFGLATVAVGSAYQFGGVANLLSLQPTAGREALTTESMQLLQSIFGELDEFVSVKLASRPESEQSTSLMNWIIKRGRYDLCQNLRMKLHPGEDATLGSIQKMTEQRPLLLYTGADLGAINRHSSEERPLLVLARSNPRRQCEAQFLSMFCKTEAVSDNPRVESRKSQLSNAERALAFRIETILEADYFLKSTVSFGKISHGLPLLVTPTGSQVEIVLDNDGQTITLMIGLYEKEYTAFGSMAKDYVRTVLFPRVSDQVPSSTKRGAEAFLAMIRTKGREVFEYEDRDLGSLPTIWSDYAEGKITMEQAVQRSVASVRSSVQIVDSHARASVGDVVPDIVQNEQAVASAVLPEQALEAAPAITRTDTSSSARLLTIPEGEPALRGYRCFLAITDKAREEMGEFFLQPHKTSIVWGGQKALFIFMHHSGRFGLYYDLQTFDLIAAETGGMNTPSCTMVLKDRIYIPIPDQIKVNFIPSAGEKKRFEIRCDLIRTESI